MKDRLKYLISFYAIGAGSLYGAYPYSTGCIPETADDLYRKGVALYNLCPQIPQSHSLSAGTGAGATSLEKLTTKTIGLPASVDLSKTHPWMAHVKSQKYIGACATFTIVACLEFLVPGMRISDAELFLRMVTEGRGSRALIGGTLISEYGVLIQSGIIPEDAFIAYEQFHAAVMARVADKSINQLEKIAPSVDYKESLDYFKSRCQKVPIHLVPEWIDEDRYFRGLGKRTVSVPRGFWKETNFYMFHLAVDKSNIIDTLKLVLQSAPVAIWVKTYSKTLDEGREISWTHAGPTVENRFVLDLPIPTEYSPKDRGHAICLCGYDDSKGAFKFKNSWDIGWGDKGYAWVSYDFLRVSDKAGVLQHTGSPSVILDRPGERIDEDDLKDPNKGLLILSQMLRDVKNRK